MKKFIKILLSFFGFSLIVSYLIFIKDWLPYGTKFSTLDNHIGKRIDDKDGYPIIQDYCRIGSLNAPRIKINSELKAKKLLKYTTNELGLVVYVSIEGGGYRYVSIKPQPREKQVYAETLWEYKVYTPEEYERLDLGWSWWHVIHTPLIKYPKISEL